MDLILMAAGSGKRFGSNKLLEELGGKKVYEYARDMYAKVAEINRKVLVSAYDEILASSVDKGFVCVKNNESYKGIASSIKLGLHALGFVPDKDYEDSMTNGVIFAVCDQPLLEANTVIRLIKSYQNSEKSLACLKYKDKSGNPRIFSYKYIRELFEIEGDTGGRQVIKKHPNDMLYLEGVKKEELFDIDSKEDMELVKNFLKNKT